ncbi:MAG: stage III sporulation protein AE [Firmicutes bacterium]|jgi:stage III sporulation protein AE|nr:stage III sporulation protein AE [Bacillota bacterium]
MRVLHRYGVHLFFLALLLIVVCCAESAGLPKPVEDQLAALTTTEMEAFLGSLPADLRQELPPFDLTRIISDSGRDLGLDPADMMRRLLSFAVREVTQHLHLLGQLVILAVFCAVLKNLAHVFPAQGASDLALTVALLTLLYMAVHSYRLVVHTATEAIDTMVSFMQALLPMMTTMLAAVGAVTTATVFHPLLFVAINLVATVVKSTILPMVMLTTVLAVLGTLSREFPMRKLASLIRQWALTLLGVLFILFFGVLTVRGAIAPVSDGMALKTAKFLTGTFVPVVGSRMAEALEVVVGGSMLIKNAIGGFGMAAVFALMIFPTIKIFAIYMVYRLAAALVEPISDERLVEAMSALANSFSLVIACLLTVGLMFFVGITILISIGNIPTILR